MIPFAVPQVDAGAFPQAIAACFAGGKRQAALVEALEARFAAHIGTQDAVAVPSGRGALALIYRFAGCDGGSVVASPYVCVPAIDAIRWSGARPLFIDIDPTSYNLRFDDRLETARGIRAVCLSYLYGLVDDPQPFIAWARRRGIYVVEDAAIALGARIAGRMAGSLGDAGVFSLQSSKIVSGWRGAVVTTNDAKLASFLRERRSAMQATSAVRAGVNVAITRLRSTLAHPALYGASLYPLRRASLKPWGAALLRGILSQDPSEAASGASPAAMPRCDGRRMSGAQAAFALPSIERIASIIATRRSHARFLGAKLALVPGIALPVESAGFEHAFGRYPIRIEGRPKREVVCALARRGIEAGEYYPYTIPSTRHFAGGGHDVLGPLANAELAARETVLLPMHTRLRRVDLERIGAAVEAIARGLA
ncbi:MAG: DegT/DnrJ/EryC1/StrS aminotransferase family protein [Planctomycetes bacterium]|nr:DegT/DnrJ/EryC1/StrS aminotransferase family protein [Planctomycetota bacterium]